MLLKRSVAIIATIFSLNVLASDLDKANELYSQRGLTGEEAGYANKAGQIYLNLARTRSNSLQEKATLLTHASKAFFFDAMIMSDDNKKEKLAKYWSAFELGLEACNIMGTSACDEKNPVGVKEGFDKSQLALAMYWAGANAARWGKIKGPFSSLSKWRNILLPRIKDMLVLDSTVNNYGLHRIAGGALNVLGGDINGRDALNFMTEAFEATAHDVDGVYLANDMATNVFYLDALRKAGRNEMYCELYDSIIEAEEIGQDDSEFLEAMFPGMVADYHWVMKNDFYSEKKFERHYRRKCD